MLLYLGRPALPLSRSSTAPNMTIKTSDLHALAATLAEAYDQYDEAKTQLEESFGLTYNAAKDALSRDLNLALKQGVNLSAFQGPDSRFKFPESKSNIVLRITETASEHPKLAKLSQKVEELEKQLKLAKTKLSNTTKELLLEGVIELIPEKVTVACTRLK
jgi:hypothetical protein